MEWPISEGRSNEILLVEPAAAGRPIAALSEPCLPEPPLDMRAGQAALQTRLLLAQEEERRHIARDLQDSTAQWIVALQLNLSLLKQDDSEDRQSEVASACEEILSLLYRDIRSLAFVCNPPDLNKVGLHHAIKEFAVGFSLRCGIDVVLDVELKQRFDKLIERYVYIIIQDCLICIHRHLSPGQIRIFIDNDNESIRLAIADDSFGAPDCAKLESSIARLKQRAADIGGQLSISQGNNGMLVFVTFPTAFCR